MNESKSMLKTNKDSNMFNLNITTKDDKIEISDTSYKSQVIPAIFTAIGIISYLITLIGCEGTQSECLRDFDQTKIKYFVLIFLVSAFFFTLNYVILIHKQTNLNLTIFQTIIICYLCFVHDTGSDLKNHGAFNRFFLGVLMTSIFIFLNFIMIIYYITKKRILFTIIFLTIIFAGSSFIINKRLIANCENWDKGLGSAKLDNSSDYCKIKTPKKCWMNFMSGLFDLSGFFGEDCSQIRMDNYEQLIKWTRIQGAKLIGFPRIEKLKYFPDSTLDQFQYRILSSMINMEDPSISKDIKSNTEAIIDFRKPLPELSVKVVKDENIINSRNKIHANKKQDLLAKNVIHFFIDSLSRDNFYRKLPKTRAFFEKYFNTNEKIQNKYDRDNELQAECFQFMKYHGIASWTLANMVPIFFGVDFTYKKSESPISYNKYFKEAGFVTGQGHGYCGKDIFDIENGNLEKFTFEYFDHEINPIFCDPNFTIPGSPFAILNGSYSMKRRCLYGRDTHSYIFDYARSFWEQYENEQKFFRLAFQDAHEGTGEVVRYMDDKIVSFFEFLEKNGSLKDTIIVFHSDHGVNMPGFYTFVDAEDFNIEKSLPTFFMFVPKDIANKYHKELKDKENIMITPYDINNTFLHIVNAPLEARNKLGGSLFERIDPKKRDCDKFNVRDPFCNCLGERDTPEWDY